MEKNNAPEILRIYKKYEHSGRGRWELMAKEAKFKNAESFRKSYYRYFKKDANRDIKDVIYEYLSKTKVDKPINLMDCSNKFDVSPNKVIDVVQKLGKDGFNIELCNNSITLSGTIPVYDKPLIVDSKKIYKNSGNNFKIGAIGDTHLNSKYCRLECLNAMYDVYEREGINTVYLAGNYIDGERRFNKYDIINHGVESQIKYFVENFPKRKGIKTYFISGDDHEGWYIQDVGVNIGQRTEDIAKSNGREDLVYIGHMERDIIIGEKESKQIIRVIHAGGGSSYATSYTSQKYAESLQGGEKPRIVLVGHFHKIDYCYPREVHMVQVGAFQDQTPFMRKKRLDSQIAGTILNIHQNSDGIIDRFSPEFITFFDRKFYEYKW